MCDKDTFFVPGCLGTCWYGKYHYMEPFTGCENDCVYCYAKGRNIIKKLLKEYNTAFEHPVIGCPQDEALAKMKAEIDADPKIHTIKLSRFTDIFSKSFVENGYSYKVLKLLVDHPQIKRIIITTKGIPDKRILDLIKNNPNKFSYNAAAKPEASICMEVGAPSVDARLEAAAEVSKCGALTTIHMDPIIVGIEDTEELLKPFLAKLKKYGLNRVMFSFLLYDKDIKANIIKAYGEDFFNKMKPNYQDEVRQILPNQEDTTTCALKHEVKLASIKRIAALLKDGGFEFVVCGLKSSDKDDIVDVKCNCPVCDGKFYA